MAECPFSWTKQKEGCWIFATDVWKPVQCRESACKLWTGQECAFNAILREVEELNKRKKRTS